MAADEFEFPSLFYPLKKLTNVHFLPAWGSSVQIHINPEDARLKGLIVRKVGTRKLKREIPRFSASIEILEDIPVGTKIILKYGIRNSADGNELEKPIQHEDDPENFTLTTSVVVAEGGKGSILHFPVEPLTVVPEAACSRSNKVSQKIVLEHAICELDKAIMDFRESNDHKGPKVWRHHFHSIFVHAFLEQDGYLFCVGESRSPHFRVTGRKNSSSSDEEPLTPEMPPATSAVCGSKEVITPVMSPTLSAAGRNEEPRPITPESLLILSAEGKNGDAVSCPAAMPSFHGKVESFQPIKVKERDPKRHRVKSSSGVVPHDELDSRQKSYQKLKRKLHQHQKVSHGKTKELFEQTQETEIKDPIPAWASCSWLKEVCKTDLEAQINSRSVVLKDASTQTQTVEQEQKSNGQTKKGILFKDNNELASLLAWTFIVMPGIMVKLWTLYLQDKYDVDRFHDSATPLVVFEIGMFSMIILQWWYKDDSDYREQMESKHHWWIGIYGFFQILLVLIFKLTDQFDCFDHDCYAHTEHGCVTAVSPQFKNSSFCASTNAITDIYCGKKWFNHGSSILLNGGLKGYSIGSSTQEICEAGNSTTWVILFLRGIGGITLTLMYHGLSFSITTKVKFGTYVISILSACLKLIGAVIGLIFLTLLGSFGFYVHVYMKLISIIPGFENVTAARTANGTIVLYKHLQKGRFV